MVKENKSIWKCYFGIIFWLEVNWWNILDCTTEEYREDTKQAEEPGKASARKR